MAFRTNKMPVLQEKSASGAVATFNTGLAIPLASCNIAVTATQSGSGTPSPDNVRSISGFDSVVITRCGKNLINLSDVYNSGYIYNKAPIFLKSGTYVFSVDISARGGQTLALRKDNTDYFRLDFTSNIGRNVIIFTISDEVNNISLYSGVSATFTDFQIEKGDTVSEFETYNGNTYTFPFGQTVYGGEYDARTGVLTVTHEIVDLGDLTWTKELNHFYSNILSDAKYPPNNSNVAEIMCESYEVISEANVVSEAFDYSIGMSRTGRIYIYNSSLSSGDATAFTTAVTGIKLVYELATPQTIQLPPCPIETLLGENNIWADTGNIDLTYKDLDIAKRGNFREVFRLPS